jgi:transposase
MRQKQSAAGMQVLYARACGLDVHKKTVMACLRVLDAKTGMVDSRVRQFGTMTDDLLELRHWLGQAK